MHERHEHTSAEREWASVRERDGAMGPESSFCCSALARRRFAAPDLDCADPSLIMATGASAKRMHLPGEDTYWQSGISACAVCDGAVPIFRNKPLAVVGGGDSAAEEAMYLTKYASHVYVLVRRDELRASKIMAKRLLAHPKVTVVWNTVATEACGDGELLQSLKVKNVKTDEVSELAVNGLFYAIGHVPATEIVKGQVETDEDGYIATVPGTTQTSVWGVFAAGDVQDKKYRQAITSAGSGCMAALEAERLLAEEEADACPAAASPAAAHSALSPQATLNGNGH